MSNFLLIPHSEVVQESCTSLGKHGPYEYVGARGR